MKAQKDKLQHLRDQVIAAKRRVTKATAVQKRAEARFNKADRALDAASEELEVSMDALEDARDELAVEQTDAKASKPCRCSFAKFKPHTREQHPNWK